MGGLNCFGSNSSATSKKDVSAYSRWVRIETLIVLRCFKRAQIVNQPAHQEDFLHMCLEEFAEYPDASPNELKEIGTALAQHFVKRPCLRLG